MPLQKKSFLTLLASLITSVIILFGTACIILTQSYSRLETFTAKQNVERVENTYSSIINQMQSTIVDWSYWDDTYQFIADHNQDYIDENLTDDTLANLKINLIQFVDNQGSVVFTKVVEFDGNGVTFSSIDNSTINTL
jgi:sensor domain CHASE-containing protein